MGDSTASPSAAEVSRDPAVRRSYASLGRLATRWLEVLEEDPSWLERSTFDALHEEAWNPYPLQSWPLFVGPEKADDLYRGSLGLVRLVRDLPARRFGHDPARLASFYHLTDVAVGETILEELKGNESLSSRADFVDTEDGLKVLELNLGSPGGFQLSRIGSILLRQPKIQQFLAAEGVRATATHSLRVLLRHVASEVLESRADQEGGEDRRPLVIGILSNEQFAPDLARAYTQHVNEELAKVLAELAPERRGVAALGLHTSLRERGGEVWLGTRRLDAVVELGNSNWHATFRPWKAGKVRLYNGPVSMILADKRNLAFLSEEADGSQQLDDEQRTLVQQFVPWTRQVTAGYTQYRGERVHLPELLARERERLVLKPARSGQGTDVFLGPSTDPATWEGVVRRAVESTEWVAQEMVASRPYLAQLGERGCARHDVIWGVFTFGPHYGGGFLRLQPQEGTHRVINAAQGASEGVFFEVEDGEMAGKMGLEAKA